MLSKNAAASSLFLIFCYSLISAWYNHRWWALLQEEGEAVRQTSSSSKDNAKVFHREKDENDFRRLNIPEQSSHDDDDDDSTVIFLGNKSSAAKHNSNATKKEEPSMGSSSSSGFTLAYSSLRIDRSGSALQDMLMAHAYCFSSKKDNKYTYVGSCLDTNNNIRPYNDTALRAHHDLILALGLQEELRIHSDKECDVLVNESNVILLDPNVYRRRDTEIWTREWVDYIRSIVRTEDDEEQEQTTTNKSALKRVVVHIRRGDVTPCGPPDIAQRYLTNSHYLNILDQILQKENDDDKTENNVQVSIFSETKSFESFDVFIQRNYILHLDTNLSFTWQSMMKADILVLSLSSFSLVPAVLNNRGAEVYYTPFWHRPLPRWKIVQPEDTYYTAENFSLKQQLLC